MVALLLGAAPAAAAARPTSRPPISSPGRPVTSAGRRCPRGTVGQPTVPAPPAVRRPPPSGPGWCTAGQSWSPRWAVTTPATPPTPRRSSSTSTAPSTASKGRTAPAGLRRPGRPGYGLDAYLAAYDPAAWGRVAPSGPLEEARVRSVTNQTRQTQINIGPNTTIVGLRGARLTGLTLMIDRASNVIVRNLTLVDARDCFPAWSPTDGEAGNWNSQYDQISVRRSENVWVDHNTFTDGDNPDSAQPVHFGRPYQVHDGSLDVTHTASLVTASWNRFTGRDKLLLIGSSNTVGPDVGRLRVTLHHNLFDGVLQRLPRVRFGQVDVYNNHYRLGGDGFQYALGVGVQSAIYAQSNFFTLDASVEPADLLYDWGGAALTERGSWVCQGDGPARPVDLLAAYNATHDPDLAADAGWTPTLRHGPVLPAPLVPVLVGSLAGAGRLPL
ncbi:polysaccharide lyase family 1 protein [Micromonospora sp. M12]